MAKDKLHIIGAGGHAGMVIDTALTLGFDNIIIHDDLSKVINAGRAYKVDGTIEEFIKNCLPNTQVFIGIGENHMRAKLFYALKKKSCVFPTLIHPSAVLNEGTILGEGTIIMPNATINLNVKLGNCSIINTNTSIDHDCKIGDFVHLSPGVNIAGMVTINDHSWIGIGATLVNNINIGQYVTIGAGSVVLNDVRDNATVYGVPARESENYA